VLAREKAERDAVTAAAQPVPVEVQPKPAELPAAAPALPVNKPAPVRASVTEMVTISKYEYDSLRADAEWLACLVAAGVGNWDGIDQAREILQQSA